MQGLTASLCPRFRVVVYLFAVGGIGTVLNAWGGLNGGGLIDDVEGFHFIMDDIDALPGEAVHVEVKGLHEVGVQGFQVVARYPADALTIDRVHHEDTIIDAMQTDYIEVGIDADGGYFFSSVLVDTRPPFEGQVIPNVGQPLTFVHIEARVSEDAEESLTIALEDGLSNPPLGNIYVVENQSVQVEELVEATIRLPEPQPTPLFIRGDATIDSRLEMADALRILEYRFLGGPAPVCLAAADANDDDQITMSDAVFLLSYLYQGTSPPPAPMPRMGPDPTPGRLGCSIPLRFQDN